MRKGWIVLLTAVLVVAFAAPAMAGDLKVTGFYRSKAMLSNFFDGRGNRASGPITRMPSRPMRTSSSALASSSKSAPRT